MNLGSLPGGHRWYSRADGEIIRKAAVEEEAVSDEEDNGALMHNMLMVQQEIDAASKINASKAAKKKLHLSKLDEKSKFVVFRKCTRLSLISLVFFFAIVWFSMLQQIARQKIACSGNKLSKKVKNWKKRGERNMQRSMTRIQSC